MPLPNFDFDPTESALSWEIVKNAGYEVEFATVDGARAFGDSMMLSGEGLDPWGWIPLLKKLRLIGLALRADRFGRSAYRAMEQDYNFLHPRKYCDLKVEDYGGILLPGGHAPLIKQYLEDETLQRFVADFFDATDARGQHRPIGAVCHGVILIARAISAKSGKSVLYGRKTTALTWALEQSAWRLTKYFARFWDPNYFRTYMEKPGDPEAYWSVESEIKRALEKEDDFVNVPDGCEDHFLKTSGMSRDRLHDARPAHVVQDGNYISARWPGDVHTFAKKFVALMDSYSEANVTLPEKRCET
jgi:putative intracellular protease/amidase